MTAGVMANRWATEPIVPVVALLGRAPIGLLLSRRRELAAAD
jgi:hypothetical protein